MKSAPIKLISFNNYYRLFKCLLCTTDHLGADGTLPNTLASCEPEAMCCDLAESVEVGSIDCEIHPEKEMHFFFFYCFENLLISTTLEPLNSGEGFSKMYLS